MAAESPFKFLDSYTKEDREIFFGRDQEIEEAFNKVFQGRTLFIYGESGTGKSSLVNCGLANRFKKSDWLPINIRRGENINQSMMLGLEKLSVSDIGSYNGSFSEKLYEYTRSVYLDYFKPVYFIFDQFEELYLMGSRDEWKQFINGIQLLVNGDINTHFIFIIRSEYLHFLSEFEKEIPEIFNNKMRIEKITRLSARDCVEGPCRIFDIALEKDFSDRLLDQLSPDSIEVELTYLQVYLDRVYRNAKPGKKNSMSFTTELLDEIGLVSDVLSEFLDEQIETTQEPEATLNVLKAFVTTDGTKTQTSTQDILSFSKSIGRSLDENQVQKIISELLERRIIKELPDQHKFELRHDALAKKVYEKITIRERELIEVKQFLEYGLTEYKKRGFLLNHSDLAYVEPHLAILELTGDIKKFVEESKRAVGRKKRVRNRVIGIITIIVLLCITSIYGFFATRQQRQAALQQKAIAELNAEAAETQKTIAEQNASLAFESQQLAETNSEEAERQAEIAHQQRLIAELQKQNADSSRLEAERQALMALIQTDSAEVARTQALTYLEQVSQEKSYAERLSMQTLARSLGVKSAQLQDATLKSLLAYQAYQFNQEFNGYQYQPDISNALYQAYKIHQGSEFNIHVRHTAAINSIISYGNNIYTTGSDGLIIRWETDMASNQIFANTNELNYSLSISEDGKYLAAGSGEGSIFIYNVSDQNLIRTLEPQQGPIRHLAFTSTGKLISSSDEMSINIWEANSYESSAIYKFQAKPLAISVNPRSDSLVVSLSNGEVHIMAANDQSATAKLIPSQNDPVTCLNFSHDGKILAIGYESGSIQLMNKDSDNVTINGRFLTLPGHKAMVSALKFSNDGSFLISAGFDRSNLLWNLEHITEPPVVWTDHESFVLSTEFSPSGKEVITGEINSTLKTYSIHMSDYATNMCDQVSRNLTPEEWRNFIGNDLPYQKICASTN